jgi:topoisomerase-4 subunit A
VVGKDGVMKVMKIADKMFVGKNPLRVAVFRRDDQKVYNMVYRDGASGRLYAKKFKIGGVTREKEYPLFKTHSKSRIFYFAVHDSEKKNSRILVHLDPELKRVREKIIEFDFSWIEIQGRSVKGSTLTAHKVDRVVNAPRLEEGAAEESPKENDPVKPKEDVTKGSVEPTITPETADSGSAKDKPADTSIKVDPAKKKDQVTFDFDQN